MKNDEKALRGEAGKRGLADLEAGKTVDGEALKAKLAAKYGI